MITGSAGIKKILGNLGSASCGAEVRGRRREPQGSSARLPISVKSKTMQKGAGRCLTGGRATLFPVARCILRSVKNEFYGTTLCTNS